MLAGRRFTNTKSSSTSRLQKDAKQRVKSDEKRARTARRSTMRRADLARKVNGSPLPRWRRTLEARRRRPCKSRAASWPPRLRAAFRGSRLVTGKATVLRAGTRSFCAFHACVISRYSAVTLRFCRIRNRFCNRSRMMSSTGGGKRPLPFPPLNRLRAWSVTKPEPYRAPNHGVYLPRGQAQ